MARPERQNWVRVRSRRASDAWRMASSSVPVLHAPAL